MGREGGGGPWGWGGGGVVGGGMSGHRIVKIQLKTSQTSRISRRLIYC